MLCAAFIMARALIPRVLRDPPHPPLFDALVSSAVNCGLYALTAVAIYDALVSTGLIRNESGV